MKKNYHLYHLGAEEVAEEILVEINEIKEIEHVMISKDRERLEIEANEECFSETMDRVVNICKRLSKDCGIEYMFEYK